MMEIKNVLKLKLGVYLIGAVASLIIMTGLVIYYKVQYNKKFELKNEEQIILASPYTDSSYLYELDFNNNKVIIKLTDNTPERKYDTTIGPFPRRYKIEEEQKNKIKEIIKKTKESEVSRKQITDQERIFLFKDKIYNYYEIKDYYGRICYIKDKETILKLNKIFDDIRKNRRVL